MEKRERKKSFGFPLLWLSLPFSLSWQLDKEKKMELQEKAKDVRSTDKDNWNCLWKRILCGPSFFYPKWKLFEPNLRLIFFQWNRSFCLGRPKGEQKNSMVFLSGLSWNKLSSNECRNSDRLNRTTHKNRVNSVAAESVALLGEWEKIVRRCVCRRAHAIQ